MKTTAANFKVRASEIPFRSMKKSRKLYQDKSRWNPSFIRFLNFWGV